MSRVLFAGGGTGGHLMPALALAAALRELRPDLEPVLVGAARGVDAALLPQRPYRFHLLSVEPIYRRAWWKNVRWPVIAWRLLGQCGAILKAERPVLAVGTGGYASGPILWRASRRGIPIALQEQNALPGIATRWLAGRARQIHLGFPEAQQVLRPGPTTQVFTLGNPITPPPRPAADRAAARSQLGIPNGASTLLVMGGSQGARSINQAVAGALRAGAWKRVAVLWSTGTTTWEHFRELDAPPMRQVRSFWDPITTAYAAADLVVARSGAMTVAELCAWGLPAILVPLPSAAADHQTRNASALAQAGAAVHLPEATLTSVTLVEHTEALLGAADRLSVMARAAAARGRPDAARDIVRRLLVLVS